MANRKSQYRGQRHDNRGYYPFFSYQGGQMRLREAMVQQVVREQGGKKDYLSLCICN